MADVVAALSGWSVTPGTNLPTSSTTIGSGLAPNFQQIQATLRTELGSRSTPLAAAATTDLGTKAEGTVQVDQTSGSTVCTSFGTYSSGMKKLVTFNVTGGSLTLTHNATSLILPGSSNILVADDDTLLAESLGSGNWKIHAYYRANGNSLSGIGGGQVGSIPYQAAPNVTALLPGGASGQVLNSGYVAATFTASIAVTTGILTVTAVASGAIAVGQIISGTNVVPGTVITSLGTGTGGTGTYNTNQTTAAAATSMSAYSPPEWGGVNQIQSITAAANTPANGVTITLNPTSLDFRSATLNSGTVNTRPVSAAISTVISSGSTGGAINGVAARFIVLAIDNAGTVELAWTNQAGGVSLDETGLISTVAEGGAGAADSATTIYSTTARSNVPYRVVGCFDSNQATAGTYVTPLTLVQGMGGQALTAMQSLGNGQTWQSPTRTSGTVYYNATGKPISVSLGALNAASAFTITIGGFAHSQVSTGSTAINLGNTYIVPPGAAYSAIFSGTIIWNELR